MKKLKTLLNEKKNEYTNHILTHNRQANAEAAVIENEKTVYYNFPYKKSIYPTSQRTMISQICDAECMDIELLEWVRVTFFTEHVPGSVKMPLLPHLYYKVDAYCYDGLIAE